MVAFPERYSEVLVVVPVHAVVVGAEGAGVVVTCLAMASATLETLGFPVEFHRESLGLNDQIPCSLPYYSCHLLGGIPDQDALDVP